MQNKMADLQNKCRIKMRDYRKIVEKFNNLSEEGVMPNIEGLKTEQDMNRT